MGINVFSPAVASDTQVVLTNCSERSYGTKQSLKAQVLLQ